jgi:hypothetical protein
MIAKNPTVKVTGEREYNSEGVRYREIEWTFDDINDVDLDGLTYSLRKEEGNLVLRATFEREEPIQEADGGDPLGPSLESPPAFSGEGTSDLNSRPPVTVESEDTQQPLSAENNVQQAPTASSGQGPDPQTQMNIDAETQRQMEEMFGVMVRAAVEGHGVTFRFFVPLEVVEAPGGGIDGKTVTWNIPLIQLIEPTDNEKYDEFKMVLEAW